jgi:hypothetical protein
MQLGKLHQIATRIHAAGAQFSQNDLEAALGELYEPFGLAAMVLNRYPLAPIIQGL